MIPNTYVVYKEISRMIIKVELFFFSLNDWKYTNKACTDNLSKTMHINRNCTHFVHFKKATFTNKFNKFNKLNEILFPYVRFTHTQYYDISYKVENMSLWGPDPTLLVYWVSVCTPNEFCDMKWNAKQKLEKSPT